MSAIYEGAGLVIAWLGPDKGDRELGTSYLKRLYECYEDMQPKHTQDASLPPEIELFNLRNYMVPRAGGPHFASILNGIMGIIHRPWWDRVWVVQATTPIVSLICVEDYGWVHLRCI